MMRHQRTFILILIILLGSVLFAEDAFGQCSLCKQALISSGREGLIKGFMYSILVMLGVPMLMVGTFATIVFRSTRKMRAYREAQQATAQNQTNEPTTDSTA